MSRTFSFSKVVHSIKKTFHQVCQTNPLSKSEKPECNDQILPTRKRLSSEMPLEDNKKMKMEEGEEENPPMRWKPEAVVQAVRQMAVKRRAALDEYKTVVEWTSSPPVVCAHVGPTLSHHMLRRYRSFLSEHNISLGLPDPSHLRAEDSEAGGSHVADFTTFNQAGKASNEDVMASIFSSAVIVVIGPITCFLEII